MYAAALSDVPVAVQPTPEPAARPAADQSDDDTRFASTLDHAISRSSSDRPRARDDDRQTDQAQSASVDPNATQPAAAQKPPKDPDQSSGDALTLTAPVVSAAELLSGKPILETGLAGPDAGLAVGAKDALSSHLPLAPLAGNAAASAAQATHVVSADQDAAIAALRAHGSDALTQSPANAAAAPTPAVPSIRAPAATPVAQNVAPTDANVLTAAAPAPLVAPPPKVAAEKNADDGADQSIAATAGPDGPAPSAMPAPAIPHANPTSSAATRLQSATLKLGDGDAKKPATAENANAKTDQDALTARSAFAALLPTADHTPTRAIAEAAQPQATDPGASTAGNAMDKAISQQVTRSLVQQLPGGDRMMVVRLTPPELGTVRVEVVEHQGVLSAHLHAEDDGVRQALERFLPTMRQELRAHDAPIRELSMSDQTQFGRSGFDGQQQQRQAPDPGQRQARDTDNRFSIDGVTTRADAAPAPSSSLGGRIDARGVDLRA